MSLPIIYRSSTDNLVFNTDYFDYAAGAGYKKYYLAGTFTSGSTKGYFLTADSTLVSASGNTIITATADYDFDITFNNAAIVAAADATISYMCNISGAGSSIVVIWTLYHVTSGGTETSLGTVTDVSVAPPSSEKKTVKMALTSKTVGIGEKLRLTAGITAGGGTSQFYFDPSGHITLTDTIFTPATVNSSAYINIPFKIDL